MTDAALPHPGEAAEAGRIDARESDVAPSFPDLAWTHHEWDARRREGADDREAEQRYHRTLAAFQREYGELVSVYWSSADASGVAVTVKPRGRLSFGDCDVRFHRATDWVTRTIPGIPGTLDRCETLAMKTREVLRGTSERVAMQWIFSIASHMLGYIERTDGRVDEEQARRAAHEANEELSQVERYYDRAGMKAGRIVYAQGMILGVVALVLVAGLAALLLWAFGAYDTRSEEIRTFFSCFAAGALGAIVSVMTRMASERNKLVVDYEVGRSNLMLLGAFRPFVGSIFGLALYFAVKGGLLQVKPIDEKTSFYWYTVLSFFAGFSERFTKVLIDSAEKALPGTAPPRTHPGPPPHSSAKTPPPAATG
jgi:hypothetical protein